MARQKGSANFAGTLEVLAGGPIDARTKVPTKADLTVGSNFPYPYIGLETYVTAENKKYRLVGEDPTVEANWEEVGSGGSSLPTGGTSGQALLKHSAVDGDAEWGSVILASAKGTASGVAELDSNGKVPSSQLPSFVDDVVEGYYNATDDRFYEESTFTTLIPPESGKSWVDIAGNKSYRWSGSAYVRVDEGVQLGETSDTAYRGDRGKTAYDFSQTPYTSTPEMNGTGSAGSSSEWARGDHVHPSDTKKADKVSSAVDGDIPLLNSSGNLTDSGMKPGLDTTDWSDIMTPLPGQPTEGIIISPEERQVGWCYNMDGSGTKKPLYQKCFEFGPVSGTGETAYQSIGANVDTFVDIRGVFRDYNNWTSDIDYVVGTDFYIRFGLWNNSASQSEYKNTINLAYKTGTWQITSIMAIIQYTKTTDSYT